MKRWVAYGYNMPSDVFEYDGKRIDGLIISVKVPSSVTPDMLGRNVFVSYTKEDGFTISVRSNAKSIPVQPYKTYFCAEPTDGLPGLEPVEVDGTTVAAYSAYYKEEKNHRAASAWLIS